MEWWQALVLGAVEGLTEFLPVSSTAHLILTSSLLGLPQTEFLKSFEISIQLGAILAVTLLSSKILRAEDGLWKKVAVAFLPAALIGFLFYSTIRGALLESYSVVIAALFAGGIFFIVFEWWHARRAVVDRPLAELSYRDALLIGTAQALAVIPGVSRSGATIIGGLLLGFKRSAVVEFSFLLAIPTMLAATGYDLLKNYNSFSLSDAKLLFLGFMTAGIVAYFTARFLLSFVQSHTFTGFGVYRIALALLFFFILF